MERSRFSNFRRYFLALSIGFSFLLSSSCSSTRSAKKSIEQKLNESQVFEKSFSGLVVYDPQKKEILFQHNPNKYFTPASNVKLLTFFTGLKILGDSIPHLKYFSRNDTLFFKGTGDPSFLNPALPESPAFALLNNAKNLVLVESVEEIPRFGPGWSWDDYNAYYSAERSALPLYGNLVEFKFSKGEESPKVYPKSFGDSLKKIVDLPLNRIKRKADKNIFWYSNMEKEKEFTQYIPFTNSEASVIQLLEDTLNRPVQRYKQVSKMPFLKLYSANAGEEMYRVMLEESDNFIAEQILLMAAQELTDTLDTEMAIDHMQKFHLKELPDPVIWVDGSGLSRYNLTTPANTVKLLEMIKDEVAYSKLFTMLPVGGISGTLKDRLKAEKPFVFAKTGSLSNNHSLSGYLLTKSGKILIFSFMNSNYTVPSAQLKQEMDRILFKIREEF